MNLNMIKEANVLASLRGTPQLDIIRAGGAGFNETLSQVQEAIKSPVTKDDYAAWINNINMSFEDSPKAPSKEQFQDMVHDMLDDDARMDEIGNTEKNKIAITNALWKMYHATKAHTKLNNTLGQTSSEDEEVMVPRFINVTGDGFIAGKKDCDSGKKTKNPYGTGTLRANLWDTGYKIACAKHSTEEEEYSMNSTDTDNVDIAVDSTPDQLPNCTPRELAMADSEGFAACIAQYDSNDVTQEMNCPYPETTELCSAWISGWNRAKSYYDDEEVSDVPADENIY